MTIAFYPDAFSALTGLDLGQFTGRAMPADAALPQTILKPCCSFFDAIEREGVHHSFAGFEDEIEILWTGARPTGRRPIRWLEDWTASLACRAAFSDLGRSTRQTARRIRSWTGVSRRDLHGLGHTEQLYAQLHAAMQSGAVDWAELAAASGFADQAHMIRRLRRHTGFTPEQLRRSAGHDEAFWAYRLLGQHFEQPGRREG